MMNTWVEPLTQPPGLAIAGCWKGCICQRPEASFLAALTQLDLPALKHEEQLLWDRHMTGPLLFQLPAVSELSLSADISLCP